MWKSPEAEQRFRATEDELWREAFGVLPESFDIETSVGTTHVYHWSGDGVPLVFLHGATGTSVAWWEYVEAFAGRDIYAIDTMGDVGGSVQRVAMHDAADLAEWLDQTLDGMGCASAHFVGTSYGGFLALNLAVRTNPRVSSPLAIARRKLRAWKLRTPSHPSRLTRTRSSYPNDSGSDFISHFATARDGTGGLTICSEPRDVRTRQLVRSAQ